MAVLIFIVYQLTLKGNAGLWVYVANLLVNHLVYNLLMSYDPYNKRLVFDIEPLFELYRPDLVLPDPLGQTYRRVNDVLRR